MLVRRLLMEWVAVAMFASATVYALDHGRALERIDNILYDKFASSRAVEIDPRLLVVAFDNRSLTRLGRWPWPRSVHAQALRAVAAARPAVTFYDVLFVERDDADPDLALALRAAFPVYLPVADSAGSVASASVFIDQPQTILAAASAGVGSADLLFDGDGKVRRAIWKARAARGDPPSIAEMIAERLLGHPLPAGSGGGDAVLIPFVHSGRIPHISFERLIAGEIPQTLLRGRILLVGANANGLGERFTAGAAGEPSMAGIDVEAQILNAMLTGQVTRSVSPTAATLLALSSVWVILVALWYCRPRASLQLALGMMLAWLLGSWALLAQAGIWLPPCATIAGVVLVYSLWSWRRLAAVSRFIALQVRQLRAEPDMLIPRAALPVRGASFTIETDQLQGVITELRGLRAFIAEVVDRLPDAICVVDADDTVTLGNRAADALFETNVRGQRLGPLLKQLRDGGSVDEGEIAILNGCTLVKNHTKLSTGGEICRLIDITAIRRAETERDEALQFLSHDIRSPHAAILTLLDKAGTPIDAAQEGADEIRGVHDRIRRYARHGLKLADDFVRLARLRSAELALLPVDLVDIIAEATDIMWVQARERRIQLDTHGSVAEAWVIGDASALSRVVINLLDNGIKFAPEDSRLSCSIDLTGSSVRLEIAGPGPELPGDRAARPFERFAAGLHVMGLDSVGLGLAFVHDTVTRLGGQAHYRREGAINVFGFALPLASESALREAAALDNAIGQPVE